MLVGLVQVEGLALLVVGVQILPHLGHLWAPKVRIFPVQLMVVQVQVIHQLVQHLCKVHHLCHLPVHRTHQHLLAILPLHPMLVVLPLQVLVIHPLHLRTLQLHPLIHQLHHRILLHPLLTPPHLLHIALHHPRIPLRHHRTLLHPPLTRQPPLLIHLLPHPIPPHRPHTVLPLRLTVQPRPPIRLLLHHIHPPLLLILQHLLPIVQHHPPTRQPRPTTALHLHRILRPHRPIPLPPQVTPPSQTETTHHHRHHIHQRLPSTRLLLRVTLQLLPVTPQLLQNTARRPQHIHPPPRRIHQLLQSILLLPLHTPQHLPPIHQLHQIILPLRHNILLLHVNTHPPPHNIPQPLPSILHRLLSIHQVHLNTPQILPHLPITLQVLPSILQHLQIILQPPHNIPQVMSIAQLRPDTLLHLRHTVLQPPVLLPTSPHNTPPLHHSIPRHLQVTHLPHLGILQGQRTLRQALFIHLMLVKIRRRKRSNGLSSYDQNLPTTTIVVLLHIFNIVVGVFCID